MVATVTQIQSSKSKLSPFLRSLDYFKSKRTDFSNILDGFLYSTETMMLYGASGSGKSLFTFGMACSFADPDKDSFLGQEIGTGKVLYLDGEMHNNSIADRVELFGAESLVGVHYLPMTELVDTGKTVDFNDDGLQRQLIKLVEKSQYDLVVLDSVRTLFDLADENNSACWNPVNKLVMMLRAKGASVIAIHHSNKAAYSDGGEVIWSGSSNSVTVFDRTCGITRVGDGVWSLVSGHKEGRSGHGFGYWVDESTFSVVAGSGLEQVDLEDERITKLISWSEAYVPSDNARTASRDGVRGCYRSLGMSGRGDGVKELWQMLEPLLIDVVEDSLPFTDEATFKEFLKKGGSSDVEF